MSEIRIFAFNFAPVEWATCDGTTMPIAQNQALFSLLGTAYGGDGMNNFALPDLRARAPMHRGPENYPGSATTGSAPGEPATGTDQEVSQPYLPIGFCIATRGIYPSQT